MFQCVTQNALNTNNAMTSELVNVRMVILASVKCANQSVCHYLFTPSVFPQASGNVRVDTSPQTVMKRPVQCPATTINTATPHLEHVNAKPDGLVLAVRPRCVLRCVDQTPRVFVQDCANVFLVIILNNRHNSVSRFITAMEFARITPTSAAEMAIVCQRINAIVRQSTAARIARLCDLAMTLRLMMLVCVVATDSAFLKMCVLANLDGLENGARMQTPRLDCVRALLARVLRRGIPATQTTLCAQGILECAMEISEPVLAISDLAQELSTL